MAGLVTVTTPVTGTGISSTTFGIPVATNLTVLANPATARMRNSAGISMATGTPTLLTWDTEDWDTQNGHSTVTNTSRYTVPTGYAGKYRVKVSVTWNGNATGARDCWFKVNSVDVAASKNTSQPTAATAFTCTTDTMIQLAVGDFVEAAVQQSSGGALSTATPSGAQQSWFELIWVSQ